MASILNPKCSYSLSLRRVRPIEYLAIFDLVIGVIEILKNPVDLLFGTIRIILAKALVYFSLIINKDSKKNFFFIYIDVIKVIIFNFHIFV